MEIVNLSQNDDLLAVIRKSNINFKNIAWSLTQAMKKGLRITDENTQAALDTIVTVTIPSIVTSQISDADIPGQINTALINADIPRQVSDALDAALSMEITSTLTDFFTEDGCTVTACQAIKWGNIAFIRFSYRLNSALTVPSNGDITDVTLGMLKIGWRPADMTNVILDQTRILIGDVDSSGAVQARSANSRGTSYTIDANAVLYASMTLMLGVQ